jgi:hypothetical protein
MRIFNYLTIVLLGLSLLSNTAIAHQKHKDTITRVVDTKYGKVKGFPVDGFDVIAWKGLPYARPPVGDLRWKKPEDPAAWGEAVRSGANYGNRCRGNEEDCLYLNVWRPNDDTGSKRKKHGKGSCRFSSISMVTVIPLDLGRPPGI